ncbi:MAG TPA: SGNH/GDSL hydrolase family protein [Phycisphaeraceae bacterium]
MSETSTPLIVPPGAPPLRRGLRRRRVAIAAGLVLLLGGVSLEGIARFGLGLGDPPLSIADPQIEYLFKPGVYHRFGNRIAYNAWSMRSDPMPPTKQDPREARVLMLGDSVINGGSLTDQDELASSILQHRLTQELDRPVTVGNASAGSWGPGNWLAYVNRYGLFDADLVVIVLSSHDAHDEPTFEPVVGVHPAFPDHPPLLASQELVFRYLLPRLGFGVGDQPDPFPAQRRTEEALRHLEQLIQMIQAQGRPLILAQHLARQEITSKQPDAGHDLILELAQRLHVQTVQLGPAFEEALARGQQPYRDDIHPNAEGQRLIAQTLIEPIRAQLRRAGE